MTVKRSALLLRAVNVSGRNRVPMAELRALLSGQTCLQPGERAAVTGRELWIDYGRSGVAGTKLTKGVLDRVLGAAGTARNLLTVRKLVELTL